MDSDSIYQHPVIGEMFDEDNDWIAENVSLAISGRSVQVVLAQGESTGPSQDALYGFDWIVSNWEEVLNIIENQAFERFYRPYTDAVSGVPQFDSPDQLWGSEILLGIQVSTENHFAITLRFNWQQLDDKHEITFYVEDGKCQTHSVDG